MNRLSSTLKSRGELALAFVSAIYAWVLPGTASNQLRAACHWWSVCSCRDKHEVSCRMCFHLRNFRYGCRCCTLAIALHEVHEDVQFSGNIYAHLKFTLYVWLQTSKQANIHMCLAMQSQLAQAHPMNHFTICNIYIPSAGLLEAVSNLKSESLDQVIRLTWDAPFSLDITGVDPDIWYRVDVTVGNVAFNRCDDINITEFNFTMGNTSVIYEFQVTPMNGAGNGTISASVTGYFTWRELWYPSNHAFRQKDFLRGYRYIIWIYS